MIDPERIPVIVGVGQVNDRPADPAHGLDPLGLMVAALLDALDVRVLTALAARRRDAVSLRRTMLVAALVSLGGGVAAGSVFVPDAVAASPLMPFVPDSPLAPSTLLDGR